MPLTLPNLGYNKSEMKKIDSELRFAKGKSH